MFHAWSNRLWYEREGVLALKLFVTSWWLNQPARKAITTMAVKMIICLIIPGMCGPGSGGSRSGDRDGGCAGGCTVGSCSGSCGLKIVVGMSSDSCPLGEDACV